MRLLDGLRQALAIAGTLVMHLALVILFYAVITPLAVTLRALRIDLIGNRRDERAASYWHGRRSGGA